MVSGVLVVIYVFERSALASKDDVETILSHDFLALSASSLPDFL